MSAPFGRQSGKPAAGDGLTLAIEFVSKRRDDYVSGNGIHDPSTNVTEFSDGGEYVGELEEIIDGLEALRSQQSLPSQALQDIAAERQRQQEAEGWTQDKEDHLEGGDLAWVGQTYAKGGRPDVWGWAWPQRQEFTSRRSELVAAAAWIAAEIERLDRADAQSSVP